MDATENSLAAIRAEWLNQGSPSIPQLAARANMPSITARRYLDGSTKHGDPAKIRALAIALGRSDIADTVRDTVSGELSDSIMKFMAEKFLLWRESNLEELEVVRKQREESEKRMAAEIEQITKSKDATIQLLLNRQNELEKDKAALVADKTNAINEVAEVHKAKNKHDAYLIISLVVNVAVLVFVVWYLLTIDAPNGAYGLIQH